MHLNFTVVYKLKLRDGGSPPYLVLLLLRSGTETLVLGSQRTLQITKSAFRIFVQPDWQIDNNFFNRPIMARSQQSWYTCGDPEQGFRQCFADERNQSLLLSVAQLPQGERGIYVTIVESCCIT